MAQKASPTLGNKFVLPEHFTCAGPTLAKRIVKILNEHNIKLYDFIEDHAQYLRFYRALGGGIRGKTKIHGMLHAKDLFYICNSLNVNIFWLLFGVGEPYGESPSIQLGEKGSRYPELSRYFKRKARK